MNDVGIIIFYCASAFFLLCSYIHLVRYEVWWIRVFDFIHTQLAVAISALLVIGILFFPFTWMHTIVLILLGTTLAYHLQLIIPFTILNKKQVLPCTNSRKENSIRVMVSNVYQYNREYDQLIRIVENIDPDLVLVVETDDPWARGLARLEKTFVYKISQPLDNSYGMILLFQAENYRLSDLFFD